MIVVMHDGPVTAATVAGLVAEQFPQWAGLPVVPVRPGGWDNATFRLGDDLSVRLPRADAYVAQVEKEQRWLPVLAGHLPWAIPEPVAVGRPCAEFPRPWSVYRWIDGDPASLVPVESVTSLASDLASFLAALHAVDASVGPRPGPHNFHRGGPLRTYDAQSRAAIRLLGDDIDGG